MREDCQRARGPGSLPQTVDITMYKFCPQCGGALEKRLLKEGEPRRLVCTACGFVFYIDPKLAVIGVIPLNDGVVMVRRSI